MDLNEIVAIVMEGASGRGGVTATMLDGRVIRRHDAIAMAPR